MNESNRGDWLQDTTSAMCLARLRRDGFVSLDADRDGGELVTEPLLVESDSLQLNLVVHDGGHARVEVLNENNEAVPGFGLDDSVPLHGDAIDQDVAWKAGGGRQGAGRESHPAENPVDRRRSLLVPVHRQKLNRSS